MIFEAVSVAIFKAVFWACFAVIFYHYAVFPSLIYFLSVVRKNKHGQGKHLPVVSVIIAAYNEEKVIEAKIMNTLQLDYPINKLEIIIVSDGSTDQTDVIVSRHVCKDIIGLYEPIRRGKAMALNRGVARSRGSVLLFSDANTVLDKNCLKMLVRNFYDQKVGGVSGRKVIIKELDERQASRGDNAYWHFESMLKFRESQIDSIPTGDGEIFAIRRKLYCPLPQKTINDDSAITLDIVKKGYRVVYEPEALSIEEASITLQDDFNVKARMVYGGFQIINRYRHFLLPHKSFFAFQFFSHKTLRYTMSFFLLLLISSNFFLTGMFYKLFLSLQIIFYLLAFAGFQLHRKGLKSALFYYPMYYCMVNFAAIKGLIYFFQDKSQNEIWKKAVR